MLKTITVEGLNLTPAHPMIPAVMIKGITFGTSEQMTILAFLKSISIQTAISTNAHAMLSFNPLMMKLLPSR
jgi:hypothetical protein